MNDKERMLHRVRIAFFKMTEAALYLDTHPNDSQALTYMEAASMEFEEAKGAYAKTYSPLTLCDGISKDSWAWTASPWPWQMEV